MLSLDLRIHIKPSAVKVSALVPLVTRFKFDPRLCNKVMSLDLVSPIVWAITFPAPEKKTRPQASLPYAPEFYSRHPFSRRRAFQSALSDSLTTLLYMLTSDSPVFFWVLP